MTTNEIMEMFRNIERKIEEGTKNTGKQITSQLKKKYKIDFKVKKIGNRIGCDTVTAYCYPENDENFIFKADMNLKNLELKDNLIKRIVSSKLIPDFNSSLEIVGIRAATSLILCTNNDFNETNINITPQEYIKKYSVQRVFFYIALDKKTLDKNSSEKFVNTLIVFSEKYGIDIVLNGVVIDEGFNACLNKIDRNPDIHIDSFDYYKPDCSFRFAILNEQCNIPTEKLTRKFTGDN